MAEVHQTACPTDAKLRDFLGGRLPVPQMDRLAQHFEQCESCQQRLEQADDSNASVDQWATPQGDIPYAEETQCVNAVGQAAAGDTKPNSPPPRKAPPKQLGEYELLEPLGEGGMGTVYKARHTTLGNVCAMKLLHPQRQADRGTIERFEREMVALGKLDHPNIVRALDAGEDQGIHYLAMEFVRGVDLSQVLRHRKQLSVADACEATRQAALGLAYVHRNGRVHRDIKPSNLMLATDGNVKLLDLGLAQVEEYTLVEPTAAPSQAELSRIISSGQAELTHTHQIMGTIEYMAPEQASDTRSVDFRADIYSLGCTLYKLLSGQSPFATTGEVSQLSQLLAHVQTPAPAISTFRDDVPAEVSNLLESMLAKKPEGRPQSADKVAYILEPHAKRSNLAALLRAPVEPAVTRSASHAGASHGQMGTMPRAKKPFPWVAAFLIIAALFLALGGVALFGVWQSLRTENFVVTVTSNAAAEKLLQTPTYLVNLKTKQPEVQILPGKFEVPEGTYYIDAPKSYFEAATPSDLKFTSPSGITSTIYLGPNQSVAIHVSDPLNLTDPPGELATPEAIPTERATPLAPTPPVDLLALLDPARDFPNDSWQLINGALVGHGGTDFSTVQIPYSPPDQYRFEATVERLEGSETLVLGLAMGNTPLIISVDGWPHAGSYTGMYQVDGRDPTKQPSSQVSRGKVLLVGKPVRLSALVNHQGGKASVQFSVDGRQTFSWTGSLASLGQTEKFYSTEPSTVFIGKYAAGHRITNMRVVPISGGGSIVPFADPADEPDLAAAQRALWRGGKVSMFALPPADVAPADPAADTTSAQAASPVLEILPVTRFSQIHVGRTVASIDMSGSNRLRDADLRYFAHLQQLQSLTLANSDITTAGVANLQDLPQLQTLSLAHTLFSEATPGHAVGFDFNYPNLRSLNLTSLNMGDASLPAIAQLPMLERLNLSDTRVTGAGLAVLGSLPQLQELKLDRTGLTSADLALLPPLPNLQMLSLNETAITEFEWLTAERFPELSRVELLNTKATPEVVASARERLPALKFLVGDQRVDLLSLVDLNRDVLKGSWEFLASGLAITDSESSQLAFPVMLPPEFDLTAEVRQGTDTFGPIFAMPLPDGTKLLLGTDHYPEQGGFVILHGVDGLSNNKSPVQKQVKIFPPGGSGTVTIKIQVRQQAGMLSILAEANGEELIAWSGARERLRLGSTWFSADQERFTVSLHAGQHLFEKLTVTPVSGRLTLVTPSPSQNSADRQVAQWVLEAGGKVTIHGGLDQTTLQLIEPPQELPLQPFFVQSIAGLNGKQLPAPWLASVGTLQELKQLDLIGTRFENAELAPLANAHSLTHLFCGDTPLNDEGLPHLAQLPNLYELALNDTAVTHESFQRLANHPRLSSLRANVPTLDDRACEIAATLPQLQFLTLANSQITGEGLARLQGSPKLYFLNISYCEQLEAADMAHLTTIPNLKSVDLRSNHLGPTACFSLGVIAQFEKLYMNDNPIGNEGMERLSRLTNLRVLNIAKSGITEAALPILQDFKQLEELHLDANPGISDQAIPTLATLKSLKQLYIKDTKISAEGYQQLRKVLPSCQIHSDHSPATVRKLDLRARELTDATLPAALEGELPLVELMIQGKGITNTSLPLLASLPKLQRLDLYATAVTNEGIAQLVNAPALQRLEFWYMPQITGEVTEYLANMPHLSVITFKSTGVYGPGLERLHGKSIHAIHIGHEKLNAEMFQQYIVPFGKLNNLDIAGTRLTDEDIQLIVPLQLSSSLHLGYNPNIHGPGLKYIADMPTLDRLLLDKLKLDDEGLKHLSTATQLTALHLNDTLLTDASVETLAAMPNLTFVTLNRTKFTPQGLAALRKLRPSMEIQAEQLQSPATTP